MTECRETTFLELVADVAACRICPRMEGRSRVLGAANGNQGAQMLFVAEAPGRLGADVSGIPLYGDQTGHNFQALLDHAGIQRHDIFITNALLCNPRDDFGRNGTPTRREICNCANHLCRTIEIVQPRLVVALGNVALRALDVIEPHSASLATDVGRCLEWNSRLLIPLYHPGPRARLHRSLAAQQADFCQLALHVAS